MGRQIQPEFNPKQTTPWKVLGIVLPLILFLGLVASRRWEQLASPQVWCEDGQLIKDFASRGLGALLEPLNGYLVLLPRAITAISLSLSAYHYPIVSSILACVSAALAGLAVAMAPTLLRGRFLCAVSMFLVPSDPEVFGLPLYTLWWAPVLLLVVCLWDERNPSILLRLTSLVIGGFSSPFIVFFLPVFYFRAIWYRRSRSERVVACVATAVAAVQLYFIARGAKVAFPPLASFIIHVVPKFCGWFLGGNFAANYYLLWPLGFLLIAVIAGYLATNRRQSFAWILVYLYVVAVASSTFRVDPAALHPSLGGPRYFFFAYILTFWILIQFGLTEERTWLRRSIGFLCLIAVLNAVPVWSRRHDDLQWQDHIVSARLFPEYDIPIQFDGNRIRAWSIGQSGNDWNRLLRRDWLLTGEALANLPTFAYRVICSSNGGGYSYSSNRDAAVSPKRNSTTSMAIVRGRNDVILRLTAGQRIRFRSGPVKDYPSMRIAGYNDVFIDRLPISTGWVTLEFSNSRLPERFTLIVEDKGQGVGEWSDIDPWESP